LIQISRLVIYATACKYTLRARRGRVMLARRVDPARQITHTARRAHTRTHRTRTTQSTRDTTNVHVRASACARPQDSPRETTALHASADCSSGSNRSTHLTPWQLPHSHTNLENIVGLVGHKTSAAQLGSDSAPLPMRLPSCAARKMMPKKERKKNGGEKESETGGEWGRAQDPAAWPTKVGPYLRG